RPRARAGRGAPARRRRTRRPRRRGGTSQSRASSTRGRRRRRAQRGRGDSRGAPRSRRRAPPPARRRDAGATPRNARRRCRRGGSRAGISPRRRARDAISRGGTTLPPMTGTAPPSRGWAETWKAPALVAALAALAFSGSLANGFVWDDHRFIAENPSVVAPTSWSRFLTDAGTVDNLGAVGLVRPMRTIEFALDHALFGENALGFHVHSLLWHAAASALLCLMLQRLLGDGRVAVVAALFWALNPVQSECVAFISSRGDVAMSACSFAAVLFAMKSKGLDRWLAASLAAAFLAMMYKETGVVLCCVLTVFVIVGRARPWALFHWAVSAA